MKLFTAQQIRDWDAYTIKNEPIASIDLMERAASKCVEWLTSHFSQEADYEIYCGIGNNGGDGLAIARLLNEQGIKVAVNILKLKDNGSPDFEENLKQLQGTEVTINEIKSVKEFRASSSNTILIDALFGTGLNKPLEGLAADLVEHINKQKNIKVSVDIPSGLPAEFMDRYVDYKNIIIADFTLSFQIPKQSFLFAETGKYVGELAVLDIGLSEEYEDSIPSNWQWIDEGIVKAVYKIRNPYSHKGTYGHALIIGGAMGTNGAVQMASKSAVKAGAGLVTAFVPQSAYAPLQTAVPEVMVEAIQKEELLDFMPHDTKKYTAIGIGVGMGTQITTRDALGDFMAGVEGEKLVIDADALNCLSMDFTERKKIKLPAGVILTPHSKEFDRMFGESETSYQRFEKQLEVAKQHNIYIVLKGTYTSVVLPTGETFFNSTGNAGMATGGSGDVLTGIITALRAQGYNQQEACILGVYIHGLAGDMALKTESHESLTATDIIKNLGAAFKYVANF
jgi:NAD(P)H-hydrate epimerase